MVGERRGSVFQIRPGFLRRWVIIPGLCFHIDLNLQRNLRKSEIPGGVGFFRHTKTRLYAMQKTILRWKPVIANPGYLKLSVISDLNRVPAGVAFCQCITVIFAVNVSNKFPISYSNKFDVLIVHFYISMPHISACSICSEFRSFPGRIVLCRSYKPLQSHLLHK